MKKRGTFNIQHSTLNIQSLVPPQVLSLHEPWFFAGGMESREAFGVRRFIGAFESGDKSPQSIRCRDHGDAARFNERWTLNVER
jgi:hypothetical protein